ncbi:MAG: hypothetical protein JO029_03070 [Candidatus Eremiobacteraeota bacterium]|nr:hypothetical protein [Candidatus Eremiobacteraeota bacterium]MBV8583003.1 hypothetical protein [Candidatus Eremiobacteraeota bacterium]
MQPLIASLLLAAVTASPAPSPQPTLKTIEHERSTQFCTALQQSVRPALAALMQNDRLIERGRVNYVEAGNRLTHGGIADGGGGYNNLLGPPQWSPSQGDTIITESRQRTLAKSIEDNVDAVDTMLSDKKRIDAVPSEDERTKLLTIGTQLYGVVAEQRTAVNVISGQVEVAAMDALFNRIPSWGGANTIRGSTPIDAMMAGHGHDARAMVNVWTADLETKVPFYDPYDLFARALGEDQSAITASEDVASKSIMDAAATCQ